MKKITALHLLLFLTGYAFGDVGSSAFFKLKMIHEDGSFKQGYVQYWGYERIQDLQTDSLFTLLFRNNYRDSITIYTRIQTVNYPEHDKIKYVVVASEDRYRFKTTDIVRIAILNISPCEKLIKPGKHDPFIVSVSANIIDHLTQHEVDMMQRKPLSSYAITRTDLSGQLVFLNYNPGLNRSMFIKKCIVFNDSFNDPTVISTSNLLRKDNITTLFFEGQ